MTKRRLRKVYTDAEWDRKQTIERRINIVIYPVYFVLMIPYFIGVFFEKLAYGLKNLVGKLVSATFFRNQRTVEDEE
ncbi:hypothetical protein ABH16_04585 [Bacillus altitudinis]|uniref:hypothetical protein n=1 Tax=Bacillus altitudinis TaxID=293387 RepID=UPI0009385B57|nr:hypothetical protein [Bacillus altitudinis]APP15597.1 hypothetical protein BS467_07555 [Bacillus altitudinis]MBG9901807.1 hypothetical protein [Bacillus altitudinis]